MDTEKIYNLFLEIKTDIHDKHTDLKKEINKNSLDATILKEKIIKLENNDIEFKKETNKNSLDATILKEKIIKLENNDIELKKELSKQKEENKEYQKIQKQQNEEYTNTQIQKFTIWLYGTGSTVLMTIIFFILKSTGLIDKIFK